jgi:hypothetical protein
VTDDVLRQIEHIVAEWVVSGSVPEADAPRVIRLISGGYAALAAAGEPVTVTTLCDQYIESLRKVEAMSPREYAALKRRYLRAVKGR